MTLIMSNEMGHVCIDYIARAAREEENLQSNASVLDELEVINSELARHPPEDRLKLSLSDTSLHAVHKRCIERVYGPDFDEQILKLLHRNPAVAVPVVLDRLRKKQDEWTPAPSWW